mmetsp:Transcript_37464/g.105817  ORF Transcript_37464/g.105817 Transcript_37464/m.105817 type:complete len:409 (+) Transcript_37464:123-1349(+)
MCIFCERARSQLSDGITPAQKREVEGCQRIQERRVKATILTGFLGAGKTTFLNFVLKSQHGQRIAVVQNEFGSISIDDQLMAPVERSETSVTVMANGCLCCRVRGDLVDALRRLAAGSPGEPGLGGPPWDGLVIECSGLSEVTPVAQTFFADPFVQASYRLDGIVCICDAASFESLELGGPGPGGGPAGGGGVPGLLREQIGLSDVCLLNKCDLVDARRRDAAGARIRALNPSVRVVPCRNGKVNLAQVMKIGSFSLDRTISLDAHFLDTEGESGMGHGGDGHNDGHSGSHGHGDGGARPPAHAHDEFGHLGLELAGPVDIEALRDWMGELIPRHAENLFRCKGVLYTASGKRVVVQGVGGHVEVGEETTDDTSSIGKQSRLVFIGRINFALAVELRAGFKSTAATTV